MKNKNILILGASGGVGKWALKLARERAYNITVVVRSAQSIQHTDDIRVIVGSVLDKEVLEKAIQGQDMVLSCLGIKRKNQKNPWSPLVSPENFMENVINNTIELMQRYQVNRLVTISAAGVGDSWQSVSSFMKFMIKSSNVKYAYNDFNKMENIMRSSDIDSLSIRPVGLKDGPPESKAKIVNRFDMSTYITKSDVAGYMLDALERPEQYGKPEEMIG